MIIQICSCGGVFKAYDGLLGYESLVCDKCGIDINDVEKTQAKHTPGPWSVGLDPMGVGRLFVETDSEHVICTVAGNDKENECNALLMAAAPELLEALKAVIHCNDYAVSGPVSHEFKMVLDQVQNAISKVEGKSL